MSMGYHYGRDKPAARATNARARILFAWLLLSILTLATVGAVVCVSGCTLHLYLGTRHYCGESSAASQPAMIGSTNPEIILGAEP